MRVVGRAPVAPVSRLAAGGRPGFWGWRGREANPADVEVLLEAIQLQEVGELEGADIAAGVADFLLQIAHDLEEVGLGEAGAVELEPEPLPVKAQAEGLAGELAISLVELEQGRRDRAWGWPVHPVRQA